MGFFGKSPHDRAVAQPRYASLSGLVRDFKGRPVDQDLEDARSNLCPYCGKRTDIGACVNKKCAAYSGKPKRWSRLL